VNLDNNNNKHFDAEHIRRYLAGEMTGREMHELEKAALEDPFLADAIEGYRKREPQLIPEDLIELSKAIEQWNQAPVLPMAAGKTRWYKYAAAAILVLLAGTGAWYILNLGRTRNDLAIESPRSEPAKKAVPDTVSNSSTFTTTTPAPAAPLADSPGIVSTKRKTPKPVASPSKDELVKQDRASSNAAKAADEYASVNPPPVVDKEIVRSRETEAEPDAKKTEEAPLSKKSASGNASPAEIQGYYGTHLFRGRVVDKEGRPLPFVNVAVNKGRSMLYTNAVGEFKLFSPDTSVDLQLKSVGFFEQRAKLHLNEPDKRIVLDNDTNYGQPVKRRTALNNNKADSLKNVSGEAEPADGWNNYDIYLVNNVRLPRADQPSALAGIVELSFTVNKNGTLTNFRIDRSLDAASDKEAIRLVKEGPKWELTAGDEPTRVSLTIFF